MRPEWVEMRSRHDGRCDYFYDIEGIGGVDDLIGDDPQVILCEAPATHRGWVDQPWEPQRWRLRVCREHIQAASKDGTKVYRYR